MQDDDLPDDDPSPFGDPLHPDDRLWRHPSEMRSVPPVGARSIPDTVDFAPAPPRRRLAWSALVASSLVGASAALLAVLATGMGERVVERIVETPPSAAPSSLVPVATTVPPNGPAEAVEAVLPGVAHLTITTEGGTVDASAVVVRADGYLVTDALPLEGASEVLVTLADGRNLPGEVVGSDPVSALAVLRVDATDLAVVDHGTPADLEVGQWAMAIGTHEDGGPSVSSGTISALQQRAENGAGTVLYGLIRFDAPVPGEVAGGPLVVDSGAVVGVAVKADEEASFGWATPIDEVRQVADDIIELGHARHAWLGVEGRRTTEGALVSAVVPHSPADTAGLRAGDVLLHADGEPLPSMGTLAALIRAAEPGDPISLTFLRDGAEHTATATLGERS
ncbi:S1C family serine protease [Actinomarinicola tropica]|uniref:PDZ domain-containing protein n=1 Tax=Actinomarinicola tropica TaxID=2789776 RepID=A0A5Q2RLB4_9ACTN|nr:trypsin-like peptidase domain-containing protein [Actinomarinicola tropica]QGG93975.1 PDZ domain-containing protein [Actinomarinicola tropica]